MPIAGIEQPIIINIEDDLRLQKYNGIHHFALRWYQDEETVKLVDGLSAKIYDIHRLDRMYHYLDNEGELYFIEIKENDTFLPIGDVTFCKDDMPVVIGDKLYRGRGIGKKVIATLINRAKELGYDSINVNEIYFHNEASKRLFTSLGFVPYEKTDKGYRYELIINSK